MCSLNSWSKYLEKCNEHIHKQFSANLAMLGWLSYSIIHPAYSLTQITPFEDFGQSGSKYYKQVWLLRNIKSSLGGQSWSKDGCVRLVTLVQNRLEWWIVSNGWLVLFVLNSDGIFWVPALKKSDKTQIWTLSSYSAKTTDFVRKCIL